MKVYCTSKNTGPSWHSEHTYMVYLGTSLKEAKEAVGEFVKYKKDESQWPASKSLYSALPIDSEMIQYYMADGWWYSIVMFELKENNED